MDDYAHLGPAVLDAIAGLEGLKRELRASAARARRAARARADARPPKGSVWFTVRDAAHLTGLSEATIRRWIREGRVRKAMYEGRAYIPRRELQRLRQRWADASLPPSPAAPPGRRGAIRP